MTKSKSPTPSVFDRLKDWLREREGAYLHVNDWAGDTEDGFYTETTFDFDALCKEIDAFSEELKKEERT